MKLKILPIFFIILASLICQSVYSQDSDSDGTTDLNDLDDDNDGIPDSIELGTIISNEQQPCGGHTVLDFSSPATLLSGTDLLQGAVYRFPNVTGTTDAIVTIVETNNATVVMLDRNVTSPSSFKPQSAFSFTTVGEQGYIEYLIQFVNSGGTTPQTIDKFFMNFNDVDGGSNFGEQNWADNPSTFTIDNPTELTWDTQGTWVVATGSIIDHSTSTNEDPEINFAVNYTSKSEISIRVGAVARVPGASSSARSHSIEFDCITNYLAPDTYSLDQDFDGLANHLDLDSDNDGILDAVEAGHNQTHINGIVNGPYGTNGLANIVETSTDNGVLNYSITDTDGINGSNFLDVDSDNDGCYDALEGTASYSYSDVNINNGQLLTSVDVNGVPGGTSQGIGTSTDATTQASACDTGGAMIDFDGIDDYTEMSTSIINGRSDFTVMFWMKFNGTQVSGFNEVFVMGQKGLFEFTIRDWSSVPGDQSIGITGYKTSDGLSQKMHSRFQPEDWTHFAVTWSHNGTDATVSIFKNGKGGSVSIIPTAFSSTVHPFRMGIINGASFYQDFEGWIDEVRIFDGVLSEDQIQRMVYQEIKNESGNVRGRIIPKDIVDISSGTTIPWTDLLTYYSMDNISSGIPSQLKDESSYDNYSTLNNINSFLEQTGPMPFETINANMTGNWTDESIWKHGDIWDIEDLEGSANAVILSPEPWSIVKIHDNVTSNKNRLGHGLFIDAGKTLIVTGDNAINNSWYLDLNGTIDLADDSQLIQTENSDLVTSAAGKILRRQEGNADIYWYNYWASPVGSLGTTTLSNNNGTSNNTNNSPFNLDMIMDGTGTDIAFTSAYDQAGMISDRWLYSFQNGLTYWDWVTLIPTSTIGPGIGYTQKGTGNTGTEQQYLFEGKPNNGTILLAANDVDGDSGNESQQDVTLTTTLIGNPYPSALDADEFIRDNIDFDNGGANPIIQGTILLWEQWAGSSHLLAEYEGGYGYINLTQTARAYQHPDIVIADPTNTDNRGIKTPTKFLPVGQAFFIEIVNDGTIEFNNSQRIFKRESLGESVFFRNTQNDVAEEEQEDTQAANPMQTIKLELAISNGASRRFVLGFSDVTTDDFDPGYDGGLITQIPNEDMTSLLDGQPYVIQAFSPITADKEIDLYFNSSGEMTYILDLVDLTNIDENQDIFIRDNRQNMFWNLTADGAYHFSAEAGVDVERFDIVFQDDNILSNEDIILEDVVIFVKKNENTLFVKGLREEVKIMSLTNMLGQKIKTFNDIESDALENGLYLGQMSSGVYLVNLVTENNLKLNKKIILE